METVTITTAFLTLGQLLKEVGVIDSGGAAKFYLAEQTVLVNGEPDQRRGRKLYPGDVIALEEGQQFTVAIAE